MESVFKVKKKTDQKIMRPREVWWLSEGYTASG